MKRTVETYFTLISRCAWQTLPIHFFLLAVLLPCFAFVWQMPATHVRPHLLAWLIRSIWIWCAFPRLAGFEVTYYYFFLEKGSFRTLLGLKIAFPYIYTWTTLFQDRKCVNVYDLPRGLRCILTFQATIPLIKLCLNLHQRSTGYAYICPIFCPETASILPLMDLEFLFFISGSLGLRNLTPSSICLYHFQVFCSVVHCSTYQFQF